jgi:hypothetical protein
MEGAVIHGQNLARLVRECFVNLQSPTLDFEGIETVFQYFFQALFLPLGRNLALIF